MNARNNTQATVEVLVSPDGGITVEAEGYTGTSCEEATRFLEEALGLPGGRSRKAEFYQREQRHDNSRQQRT